MTMDEDRFDMSVRKFLKKVGLYQAAVIGTHFTGIILPEGKARFAP